MCVCVLCVYGHMHILLDIYVSTCVVHLYYTCMLRHVQRAYVYMCALQQYCFESVVVATSNVINLFFLRLWMRACVCSLLKPLISFTISLYQILLLISLKGLHQPFMIHHLTLWCFICCALLARWSTFQFILWLVN